MKSILEVKEQSNIPELNIFQCGTCKMHSLKKAQKVAKYVLSSGIGVMKNEDLALSDENLKKIEENSGNC